MSPDPTLALAERVLAAHHQLGSDAALIGAWAMIVYRYRRPTRDLDLATAIPLSTLLAVLRRALERVLAEIVGRLSATQPSEMPALCVAEG